jgi:hypothetical protein
VNSRPLNVLVGLLASRCRKEKKMHTTWLVMAIVNTGIATLHAMNSVAKGYSILPAMPNGVLAIVFWVLAVIP